LGTVVANADSDNTADLVTTSASSAAVCLQACEATCGCWAATYASTTVCAAALTAVCELAVHRFSSFTCLGFNNTWLMAQVLCVMCALCFTAAAMLDAAT
jgi:hypothetical protein